MNSLPLDTSIDAARIQMAILRELGVEGRAKMTMELSDAVREIVADGVRHRHPEYDERSVRMDVFRLTLGDALFRRCFTGGQAEE